jgi:hypothetical protein
VRAGPVTALHKGSNIPDKDVFEYKRGYVPRGWSIDTMCIKIKYYVYSWLVEAP